MMSLYHVCHAEGSYGDQFLPWQEKRQTIQFCWRQGSWIISAYSCNSHVDIRPFVTFAGYKWPFFIVVIKF